MMELPPNCQHSYLIYARKSTDDLDNQKNSISYQKAEAVKYAAQQSLSVAPVTIENFCSAGIIVERHTAFKENEKFKIGKDGVQLSIERPKFHRLVEFLWKGHFKGVIFLCLDRASRNKSDTTILDRLAALNVDIRYVQAQYEKSSAGALHKDVDGMFAQHFSRVISEKVTNTNRKLRDEGICTYRAPIGYLNTGDPRHKPFDPDRAPIVKQLFEKYAEGNWSLADLAKWANDQGLTMPAKRRKRTKEEMLCDEEVVIEPIVRPITINNVHTILRNRFYTGKVRGNDNSFVPSASHSALIDGSLFLKVQQMLLSKRVSTRYVEKLNFSYRGLIRCLRCNRVYTPYEQKKIAYYGARCVNNCTNKKRNINTEFIELGTDSAIKILYYTDQEAQELQKKLDTDVAVFDMQKKKKIEQLNRQVKKVKEDIDYLRCNKLNLLRIGTYTAEDVIKEENSLDQQLNELTNNIEAIDAPVTEIMKDLLKLSELVKELYLYYFLGNSVEKHEIVPIVFSELKLCGNTFSFQYKNGFKALKNRTIVFGAPKTWLSELVKHHEDIKSSINDLEYLNNARLSIEPPP